MRGGDRTAAGGPRGARALAPFLLALFLLSAAPPPRALAMPGAVTLPSLRQGEALLAEGRTEEAKAAFERAVAEEPGNPAAHKALAVTLDRLGDAEGAVRHYEKALPGEPKDAPGIRTNLASLYNLRGRHARAVALLEPFLPEESKDATAHLVLGMALTGTGEREKALRRFRAVQRLEPGEERGALAAAVALRVAGKPREAKEELQRAAKAHPDSSAVRYQLGEALAALGDLPGATAAFREAEKRGGDAVLLKKRIADLRMDAKKYGEAVPLYRELLSTKVGEEAYGNLAAAQRLSGDEKGALATLSAMEKAYPKSAAAPHRAGLLHGIAGRNDEALAAMRRARARAPEDPLIRRDLAVALCRKGIDLVERKKVAEAAKLVKEALALSPDFPGRADAAEFLQSVEGAKAPR